MTSGATVLEISRLLLAAGCRRVDAWCAARAEPT
jgi:predicted amidophosphoribosyltransferase